MKRLLAAALFILGLTGSLHAATLDDVKARGALKCGVNPNLQGFAAKGEDGNWAGFDVDFCRAIAAATLGDAAKVEFVPLERPGALRRGGLRQGGHPGAQHHLDDGARNQMPLRFPGISYHDGQGFIVKKLLGVTSALNLSGASICFQTGTTSEPNVEDFFREKEMVFQPVRFEKLDDLIKAFDEGKCDTFTTDVSFLYAVRLRLTNPDDAMVLQDVISKEPLGPVIRQGDDQWFNIVRWTLFALINAEEMGVTAASVGPVQGRVEARRHPPPAGRSKAPSAPTWASTPTGPCAPSRPRATTARSSSATSATRRRCRSAAASTRCGTRAGCSMRRR